MVKRKLEEPLDEGKVDTAAYGALKSKLERCNQGHILDAWPSLTVAEKKTLTEQLQEIDLERLQGICARSFGGSASSANEEVPEPYTDICKIPDVTEEQRMHWKNVGLKVASEGKLAVILLAGGEA
ncbi:hypothetical protein CYMTET_33439 [Cymbomonas tetramitiformis]|uniref:Uncharacterized protein n=1 Tax=Cymbomonas tetramitiformis TaxID=36881 RepID=A0AAE0FD07_9CHLO|nr:hypothetical protein CYMTET_33439 [Cymbomonas tetramitiformis]